MIYLDTHVVTWMFAGRLALFPAWVRELLDGSDLLISPAVQLELQYLFEIRRTAGPAKVVLSTSPRTSEAPKKSPLPLSHTVSSQVRRELWEAHAWFVAAFRGRGGEAASGRSQRGIPLGSSV